MLGRDHDHRIGTRRRQALAQVVHGAVHGLLDGGIGQMRATGDSRCVAADG